MNGKGIHITSKVMGGILAVLFVGVLALSSRTVQSKIAKVIETKLEELLGTRVSFSSLRVSNYGTVLLKDVVVMDPTPYKADKYNKGFAPVDTILFAKTITATFTLKGILSKEGIHIGRVNVEDGGLYIVTEPAEDTGRKTNFEAIAPPVQRDTDYVAQPGPNLFDVRRVNVKNFHFRLVNFAKETNTYKGYGVNFDDMDLHANLRAHSLKMTGGIMYGVLDHCDAKEKSGYRLRNVTGNAAVGLGKALVDDLHIKDDLSDITLTSFSMNFRNQYDFQDFVNKVVLKGEFGRSQVAMETVNWFAGGSLSGNQLLIDIEEGHVKGPVNDLVVDRLVFVDQYSGIPATASCRIRNVVPDINEMILNGTVTGFHANSSQLSQFLTEWSKVNGKPVDLSKLVPGKNLTVDATCDGNINHLGIDADITNLELGRLHVNGYVNNCVLKTRPITINGHLVADDLNAGLAANSDALGRVDAEGAFGLSAGRTTDIKIDTLQIHRLQAIGYEFHDIKIKGELNDNTVSATINSSDPAAKTNLVGLMDLKPFDGKKRMRVAGDIANLDFHALNFDKRGDVSNLTSNVYANFVQEGDFILGDAFIDGIKIVSDQGTHNIGDITVRAHKRDNMQHFRLDSPFADATYEGDGSLGDLIEDLQNLTLRKHLPAIQNKPISEINGSHYAMDMNIHDSRTLLTYLMPKLYIADSTVVKLTIDDGELKAGISSDRIALGTTFVRNLTVDVDNLDGSLNALLTSSQFISGGTEVTRPAFAAYASDNQAKVGFLFDNINGSNSVAEVYLDGQITRDESDSLVITAHPVNSFLRAGKDRWEFDYSEVTMRGKDIIFDSLTVHNGVEKVFIDGGLSATKADSLTVALDSFDLSGLDQFLPNKYNLKGLTNGRVIVYSPTKGRFGILIDLLAEGIEIGGSEIGNFAFASTRESKSDVVNIHLKNTLHGETPLTADAKLNPKDREISADATFNEFPLAAAAPFLSTVFSNMGGSLNGSLDLNGKDDKINIASHDVRLDNAMLQVDVTNVSYYLNGPIDINSNGVFLNNLAVKDKSGGTGTLNGALRYKNFSDISLDAKLNIRDLLIVDAPEKGNKGFYGNLRASGNIGLSGPVNNIVVDADVATSGNGDVHVPLSGALKGSTSNLLTFTEPEKELDPYEKMLLEYEETKTNKVSSDFTAKGNVRIGEGLKLLLEIDKSQGHVISANGAGTIGIEIRPKKNIFNLNGDYSIRSGNYHFVVPGLLEKDFNIKDESFLRFGGNLMDSEISINAVHPVKTSLSTLLPEENTVSTRRQVNCGLSITNNLKAPKIGFSIDVPDLNPTMKSQVESALNTEDKVQKQFVALLLMGSFLPSEQSGIVNGNNLLYSNMSEIMSSQINNVLSKLDIPVDIGVGYQENKGGTNMFDVAVSTQLFNNRVVVNGTVGNRKYKDAPSQSNGEIVGDLDIELKLDKEGRFRLNAFSHSADEYSNFLDRSQRNGVGASYQKEFNTFKEFFKNLFKSRKKIQEEEELAPKDTVIIKITNDQQ